MKENSKHLEAFEYFVSLGGGATEDTLTKVIQRFDISRQTFWNWYKALNWRNRADIRINEISKRVAQKTDNSVVDIKARMLKEMMVSNTILSGAQSQFLKKKKNEAGQEVTYIDVNTDDPRILPQLANAQVNVQKNMLLLLGEDTGSEKSTIKIIFEDADGTED